MGRLLLLAVSAGGVLASAQVARAQDTRFQPHASSVTWPSVTPPGWYTNTYKYAWYYPWYAYYDYTSGPYANWWTGGGYAGYANHGTAGMAYSNKPPAQPYIGEWYYRLQERNANKEAQKNAKAAPPGAYNTLQDLTAPPSGQPLPTPREVVDPKMDKK